MKQRILALFLALCLCLPLAACGKKQGYDPLEGVKTRVVTDSAGRQVEIPADIRRVAPSGSTAQMILMPIAYDLLAGLASSPSTAQMPYFPEEVRYLPTFGQFYGSKANLNMESLIDARPQIIIDLGDKKDSIADDMDRIQKQTGIPTVFIEANLDDMAAAYRTLGDILNRSDMAESLARFIEKPSPWPGRTPQNPRESAALRAVRHRVHGPCLQRRRVGPGGRHRPGGGRQRHYPPGGQQPGRRHHRQSGGGIRRGTGRDPPVRRRPYDTLAQGEWAGLRAVQSGKYYEIPGLPYDWMSSPPSVNRVLGIWWLGNLLYPELYDYDMVQVAREYYGLFWHYDLTEEEARQMLSRSTLK